MQISYILLLFAHPILLAPFVSNAVVGSETYLKTKTKVQSRPQFETIQSLDPKGDQPRTTIGTPSRRALLVRGINSAQQ